MCMPLCVRERVKDMTKMSVVVKVKMVIINKYSLYNRIINKYSLFNINKMK